MAMEGLSATADAIAFFEEVNRPVVHATNWLHERDWFYLSEAFTPYVLPLLSDVRELDDAAFSQQRIWESWINQDVALRWITSEDGETNVDSIPTKDTQFLYDRLKFGPLFEIICESFWKRGDGSKEVILQTLGGEQLIFLPPVQDLEETTFIRELEARCRSFAAQGQKRGILINGLPGTGKSQAIREVVRRMGYRTFHITPDVVDVLRRFTDSKGTRTTLDVFLAAIRPDVVVVDDIDRVPRSQQLSFFTMVEAFRRASNLKFVFVSTNNSEELLSPLLRPGRLDDLLEMPDLEEDLLRRMLGDDNEDLVPELAEWPIAYVQDYLVRQRTLGSAVARREIPGLQARVRALKGASLSESQLVKNAIDIGLTPAAG